MTTPLSRTLAAALVVLATSAQAQTTIATSAPQNVVSLTASATVEVPKDQLTLVFSTTREGADANQVQAQLKQALDTALAEARKAARPGQVEVQTGNFGVYPRWSPKGGSNGWTGSAELVVEGRDMAAVSQLAGRIGSMTVARSSFGLSREAREKVESEVTAMAIGRFRAKAAEAAKLFGFGGWTVREVQLQGSEPVAQMPVMRSQAMAVQQADAALPVEAGKASVSVTVSGSVQLSAR